VIVNPEFEEIASRIPAAEPKITLLPSGAVLMDILIHGVRYCAEFIPEHNTYGLSQTANSSPFWEGVEESFNSADELEERILQLLRGTR
jgi:hypothetical protein